MRFQNIPESAECKHQPWRAFLASADAEGLTKALYGSSQNINAVERGWMQQSDEVANNGLGGAHEDGYQVATSGAGGAHSDGHQIVTSGAGGAHNATFTL